MTLKEAALGYLQRGWSIIPVGPDKRPLISWKQFEQRRPTAAEVEGWFKKLNPAGIALVTGRISGVGGVDLDKYKEGYNEEKVLAVIPDGIETPTTRTPRGGNHLIFALPDQEIRSRNDLMTGVDFKVEGGYIILPPSRNEAGHYEWLLSPDEVQPAALPHALIKYISLYKSAWSEKKEKTTNDHADHKDHTGNIFRDGVRDENLFHIAHCLTATGNNEDYIFQVLMALQGSWGEHDEAWARAKVKSARDREERKERNIAAEVREWTLTTSGHFLTTDCHKELELTTKTTKKAANMTFLRMAEEGLLEKYGNKRGCYRLVDKSIEFLDILAPTKAEYDIELPLGLSDHARLHEKNPIVIAGSKDAGKTLLALEAARLNIGKYPILYMTSEMGADELTKRLSLFQNMTLQQWNQGVKFVYRSHDWADLVTNDYGLIIVDYIEPPEDKLYMVGNLMRAVHDKLQNNVALICIQKKRGEDLGRGNQFTLDKARLYVALDAGNSQTPNRAKIVSCKSFKGQNPRGMVLDYKVFGGWEIKPQGYWKHENN